MKEETETTENFQQLMEMKAHWILAVLEKHLLKLANSIYVPDTKICFLAASS